jgi:hypothetical protein
VLFDFYRRESGLTDEHIKNLSAEALTVPRPTPVHLKTYRKLGRIFSWRHSRLHQRVPLLKRLKDLRWLFSSKKHC